MNRHPRTFIPNLFHEKKKKKQPEYVNKQGILQKEMPKQEANSLLRTVQLLKNQCMLLSK